MSRSHRLTRQPLAIGLLGCLLVSGVGRASGPEAWQRFRSERGNFSVELPSPPEERQKQRWFPIHSFVSYVYTASVGEDAFGVNHTDLPRLALFFASPSKIFSSTRDGFLEDSFATETSFVKTERDGQPARFLTYEIPPRAGRPRLFGSATMFFVESRLYVFWAEVTECRPKRDLRHFFKSIDVWSEASPSTEGP